MRKVYTNNKHLDWVTHGLTTSAKKVQEYWYGKLRNTAMCIRPLSHGVERVTCHIYLCEGTKMLFNLWPPFSHAICPFHLKIQQHLNLTLRPILPYHSWRLWDLEKNSLVKESWEQVKYIPIIKKRYFLLKPA